MASRIGKLSLKNTVFLLCDVQESFRSVIEKFDHVLLTSRMLVQASKTMGIPCIATEQYPKGLGHTCAEVDIQSCPNVTVHEKTSFTMMTPSVWQAVEGYKTAVIFGMETHVCVQQTCLDLLERGFEVHVVADGCSSQRGFDRLNALERLRNSGAFVTTSESVLFMLMKDSKYEHFKAISALVKDYGSEVSKKQSLL